MGVVTKLKAKPATRGISHVITPPAVHIKNIKGKGRGVFADKKFKFGETVEIAPALLIPECDLDFISTSFLMNYLFGVGDTNFSAIGLGYSSLYNHSFAANCDYFVSDKVVIIQAIRTIQPGDELTINYGWDEETFRDAGIKSDVK